jgi:hypothetical protein
VSSLLRAEYDSGEFLEACNGHVGPGVCRSDGADAGACGRAVHPHCREAESLRWHDVVIDALAYMQDAMGWRVDATEGKLKEFERGLVSPRLLCGDDFIEDDFKLRLGALEQVVVDVGKDGESESRFQLTQGGDGIGPGSPSRKRICEQSDFFGSGSKSQFLAELANDGAQNLTVGLERQLLCTQFEIPVKLEEGSVVDVFGMR